MKQALILVSLFVATACASGCRASAPARTAPGQTDAGPHQQPQQQHQHAGELPATAGPGFMAADVRFMQNMIGHHAQALTMAAMAPTHGAGGDILRLAHKIDISQRDEIEMMQLWLAERKQVVPDSAYMHTMHMPGMLTPEQLAQLDGARGRAFDRLFLTLMIQHHEGALRMVDELFASPGAAQDPDIFRFVTDVGTDQRDEIGVMWSMLDVLRPNRGSVLR